MTPNPPPAWAIEAAKEIENIAMSPGTDGGCAGINRDDAAAIIARHAPTADTERLERLAGFDAAVARVEYWLTGHKYRNETFPGNAFIECEIKDITELLTALARDRQAIDHARQGGKES